MKPIGAGRSSYDLIDHEKLFDQLNIESGAVFVDMASGRGDYAVRAAEAVGETGLVFAIDLWEEGIAQLRERISLEGFDNITPVIADIAQGTPLVNASADVCLMAAMLHDLKQVGAAERALEEAHRVLKQDGLLAIVEFKKIDEREGPPRSTRLAPEELETLVAPHGFAATGEVIELGAHLYFMVFCPAPQTS